MIRPPAPSRFLAGALATVLSLCLVLGPVARAATINAMCPNANLFSGKLITDICWSCLFPMRIAGARIGSGDIPPDAANPTIFCACIDNLGVPQPGIQIGFWEPIYLLEVVRTPYCSMALGGIRLQNDLRLMGGPIRTEADDSDGAFYSYHIYSFPLYYMLDLFLNGSCNFDGYIDLDALIFSELNPLHNDDELAFHMNFEVAFFSNPLAQAACLADAAGAAIGKPLDSLFWCAGSWGNLYPFTGNVITDGSPPRDSSLVGMKALALGHRMAFMRKTMGDNAQCGGEISPFITKSQYKMSMFYPVAEVQDNHALGQTPFVWGEWRNIPAVGEDFLYIVWRWKDCCMR